MPPLRVHARAGLAATDGCVEPTSVAIPRRNRVRLGSEDGLAGRSCRTERDICALRLSPRVFRIRHYSDIPNVDPMASGDVALARRFQEPSEIDLSRVLLFSEHRSGLRAVTATDNSFSNPSCYVAGFRCLRGKTRVGALCFGVRRM
jgi:hypothetical protein